MYRTLLARCEYHGNDTQDIYPMRTNPVLTPCEQRAALFFLKISILTSEPKSGIHREPDVALFRFKVGDFRFFLRDCQRPAGAGRRQYAEAKRE